MKEARELQTLIDALERHIAQQDKLIDAQNNVIKEQDLKIISLAFDLEYQKRSNELQNVILDEPCKCIDEFWCATFDRCKRNED